MSRDCLSTRCLSFAALHAAMNILRLLSAFLSTDAPSDFVFAASSWCLAIAMADMESVVAPRPMFSPYDITCLSAPSVPCFLIKCDMQLRSRSVVLATGSAAATSISFAVSASASAFCGPAAAVASLAASSSCRVRVI